MDLREYTRVLFKRWWIVLLIAIVGGLGAIGFSKLQQPIYRSVITLSALPARPDYGQGLASKELLNNYSQQIVTTKLLQSVVDQLQLDISPDALKDRVNVSADGTNLLINIEVKDPVQDNTPKIAQAIADAFVVKHRQDNLQIDQQDRIIVEIQDGPTPVQLFSPQTKINAAAGGILGALVGLLLVFLLEYLESSYVRNAEDVEHLLGLTVLGSIPVMTEKGTVAGQELRGRRWFWQRA